MATERLFGNNISPACQYCFEGYPSGDGSSILCPKHGIVELNFKCRHFVYDPLSRVPKKPLPLEKFDAQEFSLD